MNDERTVETAGAQLCAQSFGDASDPALLLVAGTSCSMDWWPPDLCAALSERGRFVLRYDQRGSAFGPNISVIYTTDMLGVENRGHLAGLPVPE